MLNFPAYSWLVGITSSEAAELVLSRLKAERDDPLDKRVRISLPLIYSCLPIHVRASVPHSGSYYRITHFLVRTIMPHILIRVRTIIPHIGAYYCFLISVRVSVCVSVCAFVCVCVCVCVCRR
jgi:hypothetical protein